MKFNLGFLCLYNMIIISLKIEYFEYYYLFPSLKEILNYYGYMLKLNCFKKITQQGVKNILQLTKWEEIFCTYFKNIYYSNNFFFFRKCRKKKLKLIKYSQLEKKFDIEKYINNQTSFLYKNNYYLYQKKKFSKKNKYNQYIYTNKTKELLEISLFFSKYFQKKIKKKVCFKGKNIIYFFSKINKQLSKKSFLYFLFKLILAYKKWKADELYLKMAHLAYRENLLEFSIKLFKMARFEKQIFFYLHSKNRN